MIDLISVNKISYAGKSSEEFQFNLMTCFTFESDSGNMSTFLNREAVASESYRGDFKRVHNYKYNETLSPTITFTKRGSGNFEFEEFTADEQRQIFKWLTSRDTASFLSIYRDDANTISYEILGGFTDIQTYKSGTGSVIGITAVFESVAPWAFSPLRTIDQNVRLPNNKITITVETDDPQHAVYPKITIKHDTETHVITVDKRMTDNDIWVEGSVFKYENGSTKIHYWVDPKSGEHITSTDGDTSGFETTSILIKNKHTAKDDTIREFITIVKKNTKGEIVVIDGANKVISSSYDTGVNQVVPSNYNSNRVFGDDFNWEWVPLYEGKNELTFIGNCNATIECRIPIKCGEF